jgi:hypothetical protein
MLHCALGNGCCFGGDADTVKPLVGGQSVVYVPANRQHIIIRSHPTEQERKHVFLTLCACTVAYMEALCRALAVEGIFLMAYLLVTQPSKPLCTHSPLPQSAQTTYFSKKKKSRFFILYISILSSWVISGVAAR